MVEEVMSFMRICRIGGHTLWAGMSSGAQVLQEDMSCGKSCIIGTCLMRGHVLQGDKSYSKKIL